MGSNTMPRSQEPERTPAEVSPKPTSSVTRSDVATDAGRIEVDPLGGPSEVELFGGGDEGLQQGELEIHV